MIGRVVKIPNKYALVVSRDSFHENIAIGDLVAVYEVASDILDPETKDFMGTFDFIKDELTVDEVYDNYFICSRKETKIVKPFAVDLSEWHGRTVVTKAVLDVDENEEEGLEIRDKIIRIGDPVKILKS